MSEKDKEEIAEIIRATLAECGKCSLGIKPETAFELISFANTWKTCRKYMLGGLITVAVASLATAVFAGIKSLLKG